MRRSHCNTALLIFFHRWRSSFSGQLSVPKKLPFRKTKDFMPPVWSIVTWEPSWSVWPVVGAQEPSWSLRPSESSIITMGKRCASCWAWSGPASRNIPKQRDSLSEQSQGCKTSKVEEEMEEMEEAYKSPLSGCRLCRASQQFLHPFVFKLKVRPKLVLWRQCRLNPNFSQKRWIFGLILVRTDSGYCEWRAGSSGTKPRSCAFISELKFFCTGSNRPVTRQSVLTREKRRNVVYWNPNGRSSMTRTNTKKSDVQWLIWTLKWINKQQCIFACIIP